MNAAGQSNRPVHAVFSQFAGFNGWAEPGFERGFYGVNLRDWLFTGTSKGYTDRRRVSVGHPPVDEELFEWIALLGAISTARGRFCFAELGAGWGRWSASAAALCRQRSIPFDLIAIEAEPSHFEWMKLVFSDNGIDPDDHFLVLGAVGDSDGELLLAGPDDPLRSYGNRAIEESERADWEKLPGYVLRPVRSLSLKTLFERHPYVDLVDVDVQGSEVAVVSGGMHTLNEKVGAVHIGTHSHEIEAALAAVFAAHGWLSAFSFPCLGTSETPFGAVTFGDGVQTWVNPARPDLHELLTAPRSAA